MDRARKYLLHWVFFMYSLFFFYSSIEKTKEMHTLGGEGKRLASITSGRTEKGKQEPSKGCISSVV